MGLAHYYMRMMKDDEEEFDEEESDEEESDEE